MRALCIVKHAAMHFVYQKNPIATLACLCGGSEYPSAQFERRAAGGLVSGAAWLASSVGCIARAAIPATKVAAACGRRSGTEYVDAQN